MLIRSLVSDSGLECHRAESVDQDNDQFLPAANNVFISDCRKNTSIQYELCTVNGKFIVCSLS